MHAFYSSELIKTISEEDKRDKHRQRLKTIFLPPAIFCDFRVRFLNGRCQLKITMQHKKLFNSISFSKTYQRPEAITTQWRYWLKLYTRKFSALEWKLGPLQNPYQCTEQFASANMGDTYFAEKIDAEMKTFPWHYPEQYILSDFIPSPCNFPV